MFCINCNTVFLNIKSPFSVFHNTAVDWKLCTESVNKNTLPPFPCNQDVPTSIAASLFWRFYTFSGIGYSQMCLRMSRQERTLFPSSSPDSFFFAQTFPLSRAFYPRCNYRSRVNVLFLSSSSFCLDLRFIVANFNAFTRPKERKITQNCSSEHFSGYDAKNSNLECCKTKIKQMTAISIWNWHRGGIWA